MSHVGMIKFSIDIIEREREREKQDGGGVAESSGQRATKVVVSLSESELNSECCCDRITNFIV